MQDDFFKVMRPPPPENTPIMGIYAPMMPHGMGGGIGGSIAGGMTGAMNSRMTTGLAGPNTMPGGMTGIAPGLIPGGMAGSMGNMFNQGLNQPPPPPRVGPLPSAPIPSFNAMMPSNLPMYDPSMMMNAMDPYNFMGKSKILYNPVTKKPQNYRTVPCRRFHSTDGCERGDNCHFIHDFQYQGRPIPNFQAWKNNNMQKSMQMHGYSNVPGYYPPGDNYDGRN
jgi:hypothetical protein